MKNIPHGRNDERRAKVLELRKAGKTMKEIAAELGVTNGTVSYYLETSNKHPKAGAKKQQKGSAKDVDVKRSESSKNSHDVAEQVYAVHSAYLTGKIEQLIRSYAEVQQLSVPLLAGGVARSLHSIARG